MGGLIDARDLRLPCALMVAIPDTSERAIGPNDDDDDDIVKLCSSVVVVVSPNKLL